MKKSYYYIVASLPSLSLHEKPNITIDAFLAVCKDFLDDNDFNILQLISLFNVEDDRIPLDAVKRYFQWEKGIKNILVKLRAEKLGVEPEPFIRGEVIYDYFQSALAENTFNANSPLLAEELINKARWNYLDELENGHYFDIDKLAIYYIKLQLHERMSLFNQKIGQGKLDCIINSINNSIVINN